MLDRIIIKANIAMNSAAFFVAHRSAPLAALGLLFYISDEIAGVNKSFAIQDQVNKIFQSATRSINSLAFLSVSEGCP
jgi:hypothetical protein